jgi:hypothetical protein
MTESASTSEKAYDSASQVPAFGSVDWANRRLKAVVAVLQDWDREPGSRVLETLATIDLLESRGYWWQAKVARNWLHFYWDRLRPAKGTSRGDFQTSTQLSGLRPEGPTQDAEAGGASK